MKSKKLHFALLLFGFEMFFFLTEILKEAFLTK